MKTIPLCYYVPSHGHNAYEIIRLCYIMYPHTDMMHKCCQKFTILSYLTHNLNILYFFWGLDCRWQELPQEEQEQPLTRVKPLTRVMFQQPLTRVKPLTRVMQQPLTRVKPLTRVMQHLEQHLEHHLEQHLEHHLA